MRCIGTIEDHSCWVETLCFSYDGSLIMSASSKKIKIWNTESLELVESLKCDTQNVRCLEVCPIGNEMVSGSEDHKIIFWNFEVNKEKVLKQ